MIRCLIVEDAPIVRRGIRLLLEGEPDIEVVGEAGDGPEAVTQIGALHPDLLFLDIRMPGFDGFGVLERTSGDHLSAVVFITAYADYPLRAFDVNALSYLLKPLNPTRFREVVQRARTLLGDAQALEANHERLSRILPKPTSLEVIPLSNPAPVSRLVVKDGERYLLVKTEEIDWIASVGEYASLRARKSSYLIRMAISDEPHTTDQIPVAQIIRRFRDLDMPLNDIRAVHSAPDVQTRNALMAAHLKRSMRWPLRDHCANTI